ncbi:MAG: hypothetical protein HWD62_11895 [Cyclobacteriaceae bacterium]|nr:MAG: hypothetical protein HWD62_11895 [Cyclobacteriaceae bacterium]
MQTGLTFFTNEQGSSLLDRFKKTLKDVRYFDILVGYFRSSGFFHLYKSFEDIEQIDAIVYNLYNLTYEEAKIVDSDLSKEEFEKHKL